MAKSKNNSEEPVSGYSFAGYVTVYDTVCTDGRIIKSGSFDHQDGSKVPWVWDHQRGNPLSVLGSVLLKVDKKGVRGYVYPNGTEPAKHAEKVVKAKNLDSFSIFATGVKQGRVPFEGQYAIGVEHGRIVEVSTVYAGANPRAKIDEIEHGASGYFLDTDEYDARIYPGVAIDDFGDGVSHSYETTEPNQTLAEIISDFDEDQRALFDYLVAKTIGLEVEQSDSAEEGKTAQESWDSFDEVQRNTVLAALEKLIESRELVEHSGEDNKDSTEPTGDQSTTLEQSDLGEHIMPQDQNPVSVINHNVFETTGKNTQQMYGQLSHSDIKKLFNYDSGSTMRALFNEVVKETGIDPAYAFQFEHSVTNLNYLFQEPQLYAKGAPALLKEEESWVNTVLTAVSNTPFANVRTRYADITNEEARAKGYITGDEKTEGEIAMFTRVTTPKTVIKIETIDRDDLLEIQDFDYVVWMKGIMRLKLREEIARAILIGDGRDVNDRSRIHPSHIRPVYGDDVMYTTKYRFQDTDDLTDAVDNVVRAQIQRKGGTGQPTLFTSKEYFTELYLQRDGDGRRMYQNVSQMAAEMMVKDIVIVPPMSGLNYTEGADTIDIRGILVNLADYNIGTNKGGETSFFDDFNIKFNELVYLYETRMSGALTEPKCAVVLEQKRVVVGG